MCIICKLAAKEVTILLFQKLHFFKRFICNNLCLYSSHYLLFDFRVQLYRYIVLHTVIFITVCKSSCLFKNTKSLCNFCNENVISWLYSGCTILLLYNFAHAREIKSIVICFVYILQHFFVFCTFCTSKKAERDLQIKL